MTKHVPHCQEALERFAALWEEATSLDLSEPTALTLATADSNGRPGIRTVLLKGYGAEGFVLYTNMTSKKGRHLSENPQAALCFFWQPLMKQVIVEGAVVPVSDEEADAYWASRSRDSQIGGWASLQSSDMDQPGALLNRVANYAQEFAGKEVPRPPHWTGFKVIPDFIEFWTSKPHRLHERVVFEYVDAKWTKRLVYP